MNIKKDPNEEGGLIITDGIEIFHIAVELIFEHDNGHGGGYYVDNARLTVWKELGND